MMDGLRRRQRGQAVVLVAVSVLLLAAILMLALDAGSEYLDRRQLQSAVDAAALAGAELLMGLPPNNAAVHYQGLTTLVANLPGTSLPASCTSVATCPNTASMTVNLSGGYTATFQVLSSWKYRVQLQHTHATAVAPIHGFQATIPIVVVAAAQNQNLPYAIVLLQDQINEYANLTMSGSPVSLTLTNNGGVSATRGGVFSNESINPASGDIYFAPSTPSSTSCGTGGTAGDLWAVSEAPTPDNTNVQDETYCGAVGGTSPSYSIRTAAHLSYPNYPEPPACSQPACTSSGPTISNGTTAALCPGTYTNDIVVQNSATALLMPGIYRISAGGVIVNGTLRTLTPSDFSGTTYNGPIPLGGWTGLCTAPTSTSDLGVIIEIYPAKNDTMSTCDKHVFKIGGSGASVTLTPSVKYLNISIYIETLPGWNGTVCTATPWGTSVVQIQAQSYYSIGGTIYGPYDNMQIGGGAAGSGVGQLVAWTLKLNGNGTIAETYSPASQPYLKGLIL